MILSDELIQWYLKYKRDLPWRNTTDAYTIWLSEVILQQTRVEQGKPYFYRFLENYPDVNAFAAATEDEILKLWQGLGYYSRGRNMLKTAQLVMERHGGKFPHNYNDLLALKGIGEYTAAAISSFAANEARAVVDGNVFRVLARYFGVDEPINSPKGKKMFQQLADEVLNRHQSALHNQAMMEFGAMLCKPRNPLCDECPVRSGCQAYSTNRVNELPVKLKTVKVRERYFNYWLIKNGDSILMNKRDESDIWANMYDLPMLETPTLLTTEEIFATDYSQHLGENYRIIKISNPQKHVLTHQKLFIRLIEVEAPQIKLEQKWFYTEVENLKNLALPKIIFIFINNLFSL